MDQFSTINPNSIDIGSLQVNVLQSNIFVPISNATITISPTNSTPIEQLNTDSSGQSSTITLPAPPIEYSLSPSSENQPYTDYDITVKADGFETTTISGVQILPNTKAIQTVRLNPTYSPSQNETETISIPDHTLYGNYPGKIPEAEVQPITPSGEIVLSRVVIPEYIIVHDGLPDDASAPDYYVTYKDYIKNVACSEIYATWPESTIYANILAIMSFTLNRVYTEFYRNKLKDFTITSTTAYDQKWIYGRNIYSNIDYLVDSVFANYLSKPGITQPLLSSYCDGKQVSCKGLSQWGSKYLGDEGYSAIDILRYYYGNDIYINITTAINGIPSSYPGYTPTIGSTGQKVYQMQEQLNRISLNFPAIPRISVDGIYGNATANSVRTFQGVFNLPQTGDTDYPTWYTISSIYVAVTRIAEP